MSDLPDELWRRILEIGVQTCGFTYKDLCCLSISSRRLHRLSDDDELWSVLLSSNFCLIDRSASPSLASKSLYKFRFEREKEKKIAAHRRTVLRKESQIAEHSRKIREFENSLAVESDKMRATLVELSNLRKIRQASVALNVWQPEVVRGKIKQVVEQNAVPVESRVHALEMELKLCKQQISGFEKAYKDEKRRFDVAKEELKSMRYHPLRPNESMSSVKDVCETNIRAKKMKRCSKDTVGETLMWSCVLRRFKELSYTKERGSSILGTFPKKRKKVDVLTYRHTWPRVKYLDFVRTFDPLGVPNK